MSPVSNRYKYNKNNSGARNSNLCNAASQNKGWQDSHKSRSSDQILGDFLAAKLGVLTAAPFSSHVQRNDFSRKVFNYGLQRNHCNLQEKLRLWLHQGEPLRIALVGGSSSSMTCKSKLCKPGFSHLGRTQEQMNLLTGALQSSEGPASSPGPVSARNLAQGSTDSLWSSFTLETMVDIPRYDILVCEFAINDNFIHFRVDDGVAGGRSQPFERRKLDGDLAFLMDIWLRRVSIASSALEKKPSIVLLYLWDVRFDHNSSFPGAATAWNAQLHVVQRYIANGMDISVLNAGAGLSGPVTKSILKGLFHPNCAGLQYISDVLVYYLAAEALQSLRQSGGGPQQQTCSKDLDLSPVIRDEPSRMKSPIVSGANIKKLAEFQLHAMLRASRIRTLINWIPQDTGLPNASGIKTLGSVKVQATQGAKSTDGRADRKMAFVLPRCRELTIDVLISNPGAVSALAFGFAGRHLFKSGKLLDLGALQVRVDNVTVHPMRLGPAYRRINHNSQWASFWVPVNEQHGDAKFTEGLVQVCILEKRVKDMKTAARQINFLAVLEGPLQRSFTKPSILAQRGQSRNSTVVDDHAWPA